MGDENEVVEGGPEDAQTDPVASDLPPSAEGGVPDADGTDESTDDAVPGVDDLSEGIITDEVREQTADEQEADRKKAIKKNMAGNLGEKQHCKTEVEAGRRDPRSQPDFEDRSQDEIEEHGPAGTEE